MTSQIRPKELRGKKNAGQFSYEVRIRGAGNLSRSFRSEEEAIKYRDETDAAIAKTGALPKEIPPPLEIGKITFSQVVKEYRAFREKWVKLVPEKPQPISATEEGQLRFVEKELGERSLAWLTDEKLAVFMRLIRLLAVPGSRSIKTSNGIDVPRYYSESYARKIYYQLKKLLSWHATTHDYAFNSAPFKIEAIIPESWAKPRDRRLSPDEMQLLLQKALEYGPHGKVWVLFISLTLATGVRSQELVLNTWSAVNLERLKLNIDKKICKTRKSREVPLGAKAIRILKALHKITGNSERLFPMWASTSTVSHAMTRITERAGIQDFKFHDFRHEATTQMALENISDHKIMSVTGHTSAKSMRRYSNIRPHELAPLMPSDDDDGGFLALHFPDTE